MSGGFARSDHEWHSWLGEWNRMLLDGFRSTPLDALGDPDLTPEIVASGWLGRPGATEAQLLALETRLGVALPPSYRSFLQASNGFLQPTVLVPRLLSTDEVDWYRTRHQDAIDAWQVGLSLGGADIEHDPDAFEHYLPTALQVSAVEHAGTAVYLLNPKVVDARGEWEAFYFAHWIPGGNRYPSFCELMEEERRNWEPPDAATRAATMSPPAPLKTWWDALRWIFRSS